MPETLHSRKRRYVLPQKEEARRTVAAVAGFEDCIQQRQSKARLDQLQALGSDLSWFKRLEAGFAAKGWGLYPLSDGHYLVTIPAWGMSRTVPGLHVADALLLRIGGAA